jgi:hypothetical protein
MRRIVPLAFAILVFGSIAFAATKTFVGTVSDSHCGVKHATAQTPDCVEHCVSGGATYVLVADDGKVYLLDAQDKFKGLGGKNVVVKGTLNEVTIAVKSVAEK